MEDKIRNQTEESQKVFLSGIGELRRSMSGPDCVGTTAARPSVDLTRATMVTPPVKDEIRDLFEYHPWDKDQEIAGLSVRLALESAYQTIVERVPPGQTRTKALDKLVEVRMDCNAAITFKGRF